MKKKEAVFIVLFCLTPLLFADCNSNGRNQEVKTSLTTLPSSYTKLNETYSDKLIATAVSTIYERVEFKSGDSTLDFPNIYLFDTLRSDSGIKMYAVSFLNKNNTSVTYRSIKDWCDAYILFSSILESIDNKYFEDLIVKEKRFTALGHYFSSTAKQDINSLSSGQSQMLFQDFITFLASFKVIDRIAIIKELSSE
jgi:hypothetical protein